MTPQLSKEKRYHPQKLENKFRNALLLTNVLNIKSSVNNFQFATLPRAIDLYSILLYFNN